MRKALLFVLAAFATLGVANAGTIEASFGNTLSATDANGAVTRYYFNADHTYAMTLPNGTRIEGTWEADAQQTCLTPTGGARDCNAFESQHVLGDNWNVTMPDGSTLVVAITPGR